MTIALCPTDEIAEIVAMMRERPAVRTFVCGHAVRYERTDRGVRRSRVPADADVLGDPVAHVGPAPSLDRAAPCSARERGAIKGLQKRAGLDDAEYRALLRDVAGVSSSTELDAEGAARVAEALAARIPS